MSALPDCSDCGTELTEDTAAPSCGSHSICTSCYPFWWTCGWCADVRRDLEDDLRQDHDNDYRRENP